MVSVFGTTLLTCVAGDKFRLTVSPITFPSGRTTADFASWVSTIRADPEAPRRGLAVNPYVDPIGDGWEAVADAAGVASSGTAVYFDFTAADMALLKPSDRLYVIDAVGLGGTAGPAAILAATWLKVLARTTPFS